MLLLSESESDSSTCTFRLLRRRLLLLRRLVILTGFAGAAADLTELIGLGRMLREDPRGESGSRRGWEGRSATRTRLTVLEWRA